jgi:hypothetical protein
MTADPQRYHRAILAFDEANAEDPNRESVDGRDWPKELLYAERMSAMLARYAPDAGEALRLAVRCQHLQRWKIPRSAYPATRAGYHQWRTRLRDLHAELAGDILRDAGYDQAMVGRVGALLRKEALKSDADSQALEDVVDLVFIAHYLADFVATHGSYDEAKLLDILRKTARKMSARGRAAALDLVEPPPHLLPLLRQVMSGEG